MAFCNRLKNARVQKALSQQELAEKLNITDGTVSNYEKGVAFPRWDKIKMLCDILDVDPNYLFWDDLSEALKIKIAKKTTRSTNSDVLNLYTKLDIEDKAEIRGEIKQMLKSDKYKTDINENGDILADIIAHQQQLAHTAAYGGDETQAVEKISDADIEKLLKKKLP